MAFGHGLQDAAKTAGVVVLALTVGGTTTATSIPLWVLVMRAVVISARHVCRWVADHAHPRPPDHPPRPRRRASRRRRPRPRSSTSPASPSAPRSRRPTRSPRRSWVSGATKRLSAVRWGVAGNIVGAWVLTFPGAGLVAAAELLGHQPLRLTGRPHLRDRSGLVGGHGHESQCEVGAGDHGLLRQLQLLRRSCPRVTTG